MRSIHLLFVCTANQCRSPMAEVLCRDLADDRDATRLTAASAGVLPGGQPASDGAITVMAERGLDLRAHRSRRIDTTLLTRADLVVTMERAHVREAYVLRPGSLHRTFTLKEIVRRARTVGPRSPAETVGDWADRLAAGRTARDLLGDHPDDDVADPIGQRLPAYRATAAELEALVAELLAHLRPERLGADG